VSQNPPYLMVKKQRDEQGKLTGNDRYEGYCVDLAQKILGDRLRYNYEIRLVKDGRFGAKTPEGTWDGMVGELTRRVGPFMYLHDIHDVACVHCPAWAIS
jgi:Ligated ion channel L-glutamate- and glycine-binding site